MSKKGRKKRGAEPGDDPGASCAAGEDRGASPPRGRVTQPHLHTMATISRGGGFLPPGVGPTATSPDDGDRSRGEGTGDSNITSSTRNPSPVLSADDFGAIGMQFREFVTVSSPLSPEQVQKLPTLLTARSHSATEALHATPEKILSLVRHLDHANGTSHARFFVGATPPVPQGDQQTIFPVSGSGLQASIKSRIEDRVNIPPESEVQTALDIK